MKNQRLKFSLLLFALVVITGVSGFIIFEGLSFTDAIYFMFVTLSTVGYGDITPSTIAGKCLSIFVIIGGVGAFVNVFANLAEMFLNRHEEEKHKEKLRTIISLFFTEIGTSLMKILVETDSNVENIRKVMTNHHNFELKASKNLYSAIGSHQPLIEPDINHYKSVKELVSEKADLLIRLLENQSTLEHDTFTKMLWALVHLRDEFMNRMDIEHLSESDIEHLNNDLLRVYRHLLILWTDYMVNMKNKYPNFFGLSMFMNPFQKKK